MGKHEKHIFIRTSDFDMVEKLKNLGFILVSQDKNGATFLNDVSRNMVFDKNVSYTNKLNI